MSNKDGGQKRVRIVIGGEVRSKTDGDWHYVYAGKLCQLYGFNPKECYLIEEKETLKLLGLSSTLPRFYTRYDGDYLLKAREN